MEAVGLGLTFLNTVKRRMDASKQLKGLASEAILQVCETENAMSLLFDATTTTAVFIHVISTNLHEIEWIKAELTRVCPNLENDSRLKCFIRAPASTDLLESVVRRL